MLNMIDIQASNFINIMYDPWPVNKNENKNWGIMGNIWKVKVNMHKITY